MEDAVSLDARRVLGRTRVLKARLKARVADLSQLAETNKEKAQVLEDLKLRSANLVEERRRIESAEKIRAASMQLGGAQMAAFDPPTTVGGLLKSCPYDNAKEFIGHVAEVREALMQLFARTAENEKLALTEAIALDEIHRERINDAASALRLLHDSADRMQQRVEKRACDEKADTTMIEKLRMLMDARRAELGLYDAKRATLQRELDMMGSQKGHDMPPAGAEDDAEQQHDPNLADQIIETIQRALDELEKPR